MRRICPKKRSNLVRMAIKPVETLFTIKKEANVLVPRRCRATLWCMTIFMNLH
jgi:hypothetical protein